MTEKERTNYKKKGGKKKTEANEDERGHKMTHHIYAPLYIAWPLQRASRSLSCGRRQRSREETSPLRQGQSPLHGGLHMASQVGGRMRSMPSMRRKPLFLACARSMHCSTETHLRGDGEERRRTCVRKQRKFCPGRHCDIDKPCRNTTRKRQDKKREAWHLCWRDLVSSPGSFRVNSVRQKKDAPGGQDRSFHRRERAK